MLGKKKRRSKETSSANNTDSINLASHIYTSSNENNQTINQNLDVKKFSEKVDKELTHNLVNSPSKNQSKKKKTAKDMYNDLYNNYTKNQLNINLISMINQLINTSKTLPNEMKLQYGLNELLLKVVKELMMNDLEIVYLSLYLDVFGWSNENYDIFENFIITGLSVKKFLNEDIDIIENYINEKYKDMKNKFNNWINSQSKNKQKFSISPRMVNQRNNLLKKPYNSFCRNNYIDYNDAVDKILKLSLSYNEINKQNRSKKNNEVDFQNTTNNNEISDFKENENKFLLLDNNYNNGNNINSPNSNMDIKRKDSDSVISNNLYQNNMDLNLTKQRSNVSFNNFI